VQIVQGEQLMGHCDPKDVRKGKPWCEQVNEPGFMQVSRVWWDGDKLMAQPIALEDMYEQAQPVATVADLTPQKRHDFINDGWGDSDPLYTAQPPRQPWVGLTGFEQKELMVMSAREAVFATEAKLKEKNT
jgi:hypothetical protein